MGKETVGSEPDREEQSGRIGAEIEGLKDGEAIDYAKELLNIFNRLATDDLAIAQKKAELDPAQTNLAIYRFRVPEIEDRYQAVLERNDEEERRLTLYFAREKFDLSLSNFEESFKSKSSYNYTRLPPYRESLKSIREAEKERESLNKDCQAIASFLFKHFEHFDQKKLDFA
jgi:hypothetical protein